MAGLLSSRDVDRRTVCVPSIAGLMFSLDKVLRILTGDGLIVSSESLLCKALIGITMSGGLILRIGLVALIDSSLNSTFRIGLIAGTDISFILDFRIGIIE